MCSLPCPICIHRIAVFSVTVLHDERIVIVAEQRPDSTEEDSFQWMSRVLQVARACPEPPPCSRHFPCAIECSAYPSFLPQTHQLLNLGSPPGAGWGAKQTRPRGQRCAELLPFARGVHSRSSCYDPESVLFSSQCPLSCVWCSTRVP